MRILDTNNKEETLQYLHDLISYTIQLEHKINKAIDYLTCYEAISTIQGLDDIEKNKELDEKTMNIMVERYLKVHHKLLNILKGDDENGN